MPSQFRSKSDGTIVEAVQFDGTFPSAKAICKLYHSNVGLALCECHHDWKGFLYLRTASRLVDVKQSDWIVTDYFSRYMVPDKTFAAEYVADSAAPPNGKGREACVRCGFCPAPFSGHCLTCAVTQ